MISVTKVCFFTARIQINNHKLRSISFENIRNFENLIKFCNVVENIATIDVILMSLVWSLDILLGLKVLKESLQGSIYEKVALKNIVKFARKHLCWGFIFNKIAGWKPTTSSTRDSGTCVFLLVLKNSERDLFYKHLRTAASEEQNLLLEPLFVILETERTNVCPDKYMCHLKFPNG